MKKLVILAVMVVLFSGCSSTKKRTTQETQFTVSTVVKPTVNGMETVSVSTTGLVYHGPYNLNVSVASGTPQPSTNVTNTQPPPKDVWYSSNSGTKKVIVPEKTPPVETNGKNPNTNKVVWAD